MFSIDPMSRVPIYEQLTDQVEKLLLIGVLKPGAQLPSVRAMSCQLSINPNTVQKAYNDLCAKGILCAVPGKGCFVAPDAVNVLKAQRRGQLQTFADVAKELRLAGVSKDDLLAVLDDIYSERSDASC